MQPPRTIADYGFLSVEELHGTAGVLTQLLNHPDLPPIEQVTPSLPLPIAARLLYTLGKLAEAVENAAVVIAHMRPEPSEDRVSSGLGTISYRPSPDAPEVKLGNLAEGQLFALCELAAALRAAKPYEPPRVQPVKGVIIGGGRR